MKKNEIIELNGTEYTVELNRESFLQIDKLCNVDKSFNIIQRGFYHYMDDVEIDDNFDVDSLNIELSDEALKKEADLKNQTMNRLVERAFLIWLNPNHHLNITEVRELLKPYLDDEEKSRWLFEKFGQFYQESYQIRESYVEERKNLEAQINKK